MRIAFVAIGDPLDVHNWSGTNYHFYKALEEDGHDLFPVRHLRIPFFWFWRVIRRIILMFTGKLWMITEEPWVLRSYARQVRRQLKGKEYDLILSSTVLPIAELEIDVPMVYIADASMGRRERDFYHIFPRRSVQMARRAERQALERCKLAFYAADWAANDAAVYDPGLIDKIRVLPFGANMTCTRTAQEIEGLLAEKASDVCALLFVGVDWVRKGGDFAVGVAQAMNDAGVVTELHIVGCDPDKPVPGFVKCHGFISKKTDSGRNALNNLYEKAHFFICPSLEECYGVVFCEASSFGIPSIASKTGGMTTIVKDGVNGFLVELDSDPADCASRMVECFCDKDRYAQLARSSFGRYKDVLNWGAAVNTINEELSRAGIS